MPNLLEYQYVPPEEQQLQQPPPQASQEAAPPQQAAPPNVLTYEYTPPPPSPPDNYIPGSTYIPPQQTQQPPPQEAAPPQQAAPPNVLTYEYTPPPPPPPDNYIPGSTYIPPQQTQPTPQAPAPNPNASATAVPKDPFSGLTDPLRQAGEAIQRGDVLGAAGAVVGGYSQGTYERGRDVTGQMVHDQIHYGDPYKTTGTFDPQGFKEHPENILSAPGALLNTLGGPHGPQDPNEGIYDFYSNPQNAAQADALYQQSQDIGVYLDLYEENQHRTLATGGPGGALRGMVRSIGTDVGTLPMAAAGAAGEATALGLKAAGETGLARGVMVPTRVAQGLYDPTDPALLGIGKVAQKVGILAPSESGKRAIQAQQIGEMVSGASGDRRIHNAVAGLPPEAAPPVFGPVVPPPEPVAPMPGPPSAASPGPSPFSSPPGSTPGSALTQNIGSIMRRDMASQPDAATTLAIDDAVRAGDADAFRRLTGRELFGPPPPPFGMASQPMSSPEHPFPPGTVAPPPVRRPTNPSQWTTKPADDLTLKRDALLSRGISFDRDANGRPYFSWEDGQPITRVEMDVAHQAMKSIPPQEWLPTDEQFSWWTRMKSAMTSSGYMYDDWPAGKRSARAATAPASVKAGERFHDLTVKRITKYGDNEVQRLADNYAIKQAQSPDGSINMSNRAIALKEALDSANYKREVTFTHPGDTIRYMPKNKAVGDPIVGRVPIATPPMAALRSSPGSDGEFFDRMLLRPGNSKDDQLRQQMALMLHAPDAWENPGPFVDLRKTLYRRTITGAPGSEPIWAKPDTPGAKKWPAAAARYSEFYDRWKQSVPFSDANLPPGYESPQQQAFRQHLDSRMQQSELRQQFDNQQTYDILRQSLDDLGLHDIGLRLGDRYLRNQFGEMDPFGGVKANAQYQPGNKVIAIGLKFSRFPEVPVEDLAHLVDHEAIHALRDLNLITPQEWEILTRAAEVTEHPAARGRSFHQAATQTYAHYGNWPERYDEEAVAMMFASWSTGTRHMPEVESIFGKIFQFFRQVALRLQGSDAESVMRSIQSGEIGSRPRQLGNERGMAGDFSDITSQEQWTTPEPHDAYMAGIDRETPITWHGKITPVRQLIGDVSDELDEGRVLAQKTTLTDAENKRLVTLQKEYGDYLREPWATASDQELNRVTGLYVPEQWLKSLPPLAKKAGVGGAIGGLGQVANDIASFRRIVGLSNYAAAPRQTLTQYLGNAVALFLANPGVLPSYANLPKLVKTLKTVRSEGKVLTDLQVDRVAHGLPNREYRLNQNIIKHDQIDASFFDKASRVFAPQILRDIVSTPDVFARDMVEGGIWKPGIKRAYTELPRQINTRVGEFRDRGLMLGKVDREVNDILADYTPKGSKTPVIKPAQLEEELRTRLSGRDGVSADTLYDFTHRVGKDWANTLNTLDNAAVAKGNDVLFTWDYSKLDEGISKVFLYHYWATHASALYAKSFLKKPWLFGAFLRVGEQMQQEAEQGDYPDWLKMFTRVLNTPAGTALWFNPIDMFSTAYFLADWQYGGDPNGFAKDLTSLGELRNWSFFAINPVVEYGLWLVNAFGGEDAKVPQNLTGLDRMTTVGTAILNHLGYAGSLGDFHSDGQGNFIPFEPRPLTEMANNLGMALGRPVVDPYAGQAANARGFVQDELLKGHPEWATDPNGADLLVQAINDEEAQADAGNPSQLWLDAQRQALELNIAGPEFPGLPGPLQDIFSVGVRLLSPVRMTAQSSTKILRQHPDMGPVIGQEAPAVGVEDTYDTKRIKGRPFETLQASQLDMLVQQYYEQGDPALRDVSKTFYGIGYGSLPSDSTVDIVGQKYSQADLAGMDEGARWDMAHTWLRDQGYAPSDLDAMQAQQDAFVAANPELQGYLDYKSTIRDMGVEQFTDQALRSSPSFARFMERSGYAPGTADFYGLVDNPDAYVAMQGQPTSIFDPLNMPPAGSMPQNAQNGPASASDTSGSTWDTYVTGVEDDVANIHAGQVILDSLFGKDTYRAGQYIGSKDDWNLALAEFKRQGVYVPKQEDASDAYDYYFNWLPANATAPGHEVGDYLDQKPSTGGSGGGPTLPSPEEIGTYHGYEVVDTTPKQGGVAGSLVPATINDYIPLRTGPSQGNPSSLQQDLPPGVSVQIVTRKNGWSEIIVLGLDGVVGWVPDSFLKKAA